LRPSIVRELREQDFALLSLDRGTEPSVIKALRARHHQLARMMAQGLPTQDLVAATGYSESRISILKSDPTFRELVSYYERVVEDVYIETHARLAGISNTALDIINERMEDDPEKISMGQLIEVAKLGADRTGHGPTSTQNTNVNIGFASRLEEARNRARTRMLDITPKDAAE
jgi:hypothetical protein